VIFFDGSRAVVEEIDLDEATSKAMKTAMIPARMGSQRLAQKNLRELAGVPLITRAIRRCLAAGVFDEVWVNSEHEDFAAVADNEGVSFHKRPPELAGNQATSEDYVAEFLEQHDCEYLFQVHSIAPLLTVTEIRQFVEALAAEGKDVGLSVVNHQLECLCAGDPVNFNFDTKTNSQDLVPVQKICWCITGWRRTTYLEAYRTGRCATYAGSVGVYPVSEIAGQVVKTEADLRVVEALYPLIDKKELGE
jgi:CMP-N-acetylneuraminic acid synthetase